MNDRFADSLTPHRLSGQRRRRAAAGFRIAFRISLNTREMRIAYVLGLFLGYGVISIAKHRY